MNKKEGGKEILKIILDSNALFVPLQFKIDIFDDLKRLLNVNFEVVLLSPIRKELEKLVNEGSPKIRKHASYALKLAEKCKLVEVNEETAYSPDDIIAKIAKEWNSPVFTNDTQLRRRLRNINVPVIYVRQKSRLEIDGRL
ncbi:MAG: DNA-binding protein [Candidatus Bathyarchaeia archaeon]